MEPTANQTPAPFPPNTPPSFPQATPVASPVAQAPSPSPAPSNEPIVTHPKSGGKGKIIIFVGIALLILVIALGATAFLLTNRNKNSSSSSQISCSEYSYSIAKDGVVSIINNGVNSIPAQEAIVFVDSIEYPSLNYTEIAAGQSMAVGEVTVPSDGSFTWQITDPLGCSSSGEYLSEVIAQCREIIAYNEDWEEILPSQLSDIVSGDVLRFVVTSTTQNGLITKARFTINGELMPETTLLRPGTTNEYYEEYEVSDEVTNLVINAELFHSDLGWF